MAVDRLIAMAALIVMLARSGIVYPQTLVVNSVAETDNGKYAVELSTASGIAYTMETDMDDLSPGDVMAVIMHCAGTPDDIRDDSVVVMRYSGLCLQRADNEVILLADSSGDEPDGFAIVKEG